MLKLIMGRSGTGKTTAVLRRMCQEGKERPQVLMVPEQQSHEMERMLCQVGGDSSALWAEILSFSRLANRIFQRAGGLCEQEMDAGGRLLLMYHAVKQVSSQLTVYSRPSRRPAFLQSLLETVDELKSCCVQPEMLIHVGEELSGENGAKLRDLGLICGNYQNLVSQSALDPKDRLTRAAEKLKHCAWGAGKDFWLDGFTDFTPQQELILSQLIKQANAVTVTLTCDHLEEDEGGVGIFSPARKTAQSLIRLAQKEHIPCEIEHLLPHNQVKKAPLCFLEENLFSNGGSQPVSSEGTVELFQAGSIRSEVEWVASNIRRMVRENGMRYRDIGVVTRDYSLYRDYVESVFPKYEVPVFSSSMSDILDKPILSLVTAALESVEGNYTYDDIFRYLKTGLTDIPQDDVDRLENYVLTWNLRGSHWTQSKDWNWHPKGYGMSFEEEDRQKVVHLDQVRRQIVAPLEQLRKNPGKTGRDQSMALYHFLEEIGLPECLERRMNALRQQGMLQLAEEYRQLWEILCGGLEQCAALLEDTPMELKEFAQIFRLVLSQYDVGTIPVSLDRVTAGEMMRQTGHSVKVLFLMGADDGNIPHIGTTPGLLSDEDRSALNGYGLELKQSQRELLNREMTTAYQISTRPSDKLIVSWAIQGNGGEEQRPCFLIQRLKRLFSDLTVISEEETDGVFRLEAPKAALEQTGRYPAVKEVMSALPEYAEEVKRVEGITHWHRGSLSRRSVERLYGSRIPMSASRMDKYKSCHFSYFMRYGLNAQPRKLSVFSAPEYGTFVHYVLEKVLQDERLKGDGLKKAADGEGKEYLHQVTKRAIEEYIEQELGGLEGQSQRFRYLFHRLLRCVYAVVENVVEELSCSEFKPISFELGFGKRGDLPPVELSVDGVTISITGFVDRVDGWVHDGRLHLRVVDYKTGRKSFDMTEVWNGLGLQMLLYLFTLERQGKQFYGMDVTGSGVLYLPARDVIIKGSRTMTQEQWRKQMDKELTRSGLILDDPQVLEAMEQAGNQGYRFLPLKVSKTTGEISGDALVNAEQLGRLGKHIQQILRSICKELAQGNISADPYWRGPDKNACLYCDYAAACHFEEGRGGDCRRWMPKLKTEEFWEQVASEKDETQGG